jgi:MazG family protein
MKSQSGHCPAGGRSVAEIPAKADPAPGENTDAAAFLELWKVIRRLRAPGGCPWDRQQTLASMKPRLIEELYEFIDALEQGDRAAMAEELGDMQFLILFFILLGQEEGAFSLHGVLEAVKAKLVRRHPHVFGDETLRDAGEVRDRWEVIKAQVEGKGSASLLDRVPRSLPPLQKAHEFGRRCQKIGFDWPEAADLLPKIDEEVAEIRDAWKAGDSSAVGEEVGDLLLVLVSFARLLELDADSLLRQANEKFERRFRRLETLAAAAGTRLADLSLAAQEQLWAASKDDVG